MSFPYYEVTLKPRLLENGKYQAGCTLLQHTGSDVNVILPDWKLEKQLFDNKVEANKMMRKNIIHYFKNKLGLNDPSNVVVTEN